MPIVMQRLLELRLNGEPINLAMVEIGRGGQSYRCTTITPESPLEFPSGEYLTITVHQHMLPPGKHELEATAQLLGFGTIAARWHDQLV